MSTAPDVLVAVLARLQGALADGDLDTAMTCFLPDGALYGVGETEHAHGAREVRAFLDGLVGRGLAPRWSVGEPHTRVEGDEILFVVDAVLEVDERRGPVSHRFRMAGILRGFRGSYRFELFNGFEPLLRPSLQLVAS